MNVKEMSVADLIHEGRQTKLTIDNLQGNLDAINGQLAKLAEFKPGKKTATLIGANIRAKVQLRENVKWIQENLNIVSQHFEHFRDAFKTEWKPVSAEALKIACVNPEFAKAIEWASEKKPGKPGVTYELIEEKPEEVADAA